jgi:hypothetical protein
MLENVTQHLKKYWAEYIIGPVLIATLAVQVYNANGIARTEARLRAVHRESIRMPLEEKIYQALSNEFDKVLYEVKKQSESLTE